MTARWLAGLSLDLRSLALFRLALGSCLIADIIHRIPLIDDFYTDRGVLPREALFRLGDPWTISFHAISGQWGVEFALFLLTLVFAVGFTAGYRTRLCAIGSWLLVSSMHTRNPMAIHGADLLMRLLLFWSIFLPLNGRFSLDRALNSEAPTLPAKHLSVPGLALVFQICAMYWFAASEKMHPVWLTEQSAIYYALSADALATPFGRSLLVYPGLLRLMTTGTLVLETLGPLVAISPVLSGPLRLLMVVIFIGFHAGMGLALRLGTFSWVCSAAWLALLPGAFWIWLERRFSGGTAREVTESRGLIAWSRKAEQRIRSLARDKSLVPPGPREPGLMSNLLVVAALFLVTSSLLSKTGITGGLPEPNPGYGLRLFSLTQLGQKWRMFAPYPSPEDGWYVIEGIEQDSTRIDIWNGGGVPTDVKPAVFAAVYRNSQWTEYLMLLWNRGFAGFRPYFGRYLCRTWNEKHRGAQQVMLVNVGYMLELTPPPGQPLPNPVKLLVWRQSCIDKPDQRGGNAKTPPS